MINGDGATMSLLEDQMEAGSLALSTFLKIEGTFNNTSGTTIGAVRRRHKAPVH